MLIARWERLDAAAREAIVGTFGDTTITPEEIETTAQYHGALVEVARIQAEVAAKKQVDEAAKKQAEKSTP